MIQGTTRAIVIAILTSAILSSQANNFEDLKIDRVSAGHKFTEGPVWSPEGYLLFSDVPNDKILKFVPGKGTQIYRDNSNGANGNAVDDKGRLLSCESRTRRLVRESKGQMETVAEKWQGVQMNAPNDITVRKDGHVWFTDPAFGEQADKKTMDYYGVYHVSPKGVVTQLLKMTTRPNGITLSPNGKVLYISDSDARNVRAYDVDGKGALGNERVFVSNIDGSPDGIKTDEKGNLYVTGNEIFIYSPQGKLIRGVKTPEVPRNLAFGDPDFQTLYVTAFTSVYRIRMPFKGAQP
jgi:gluconolactonase